MKKNIETSITIAASPEKVWHVITDYESYPNWNPFVKKICGDKHVGGKLRIEVEPPNQNRMTFTPVILAFEERKEFRWKGKLFINGLFDGEHYFVLRNIDDKTTVFVHGENFSGILVSLFSKVFVDTELGFKNMNDAIKNRSENT